MVFGRFQGDFLLYYVQLKNGIFMHALNSAALFGTAVYGLASCFDRYAPECNTKDKVKFTALKCISYLVVSAATSRALVSARNVVLGKAPFSPLSFVVMNLANALFKEVCKYYHWKPTNALPKSLKNCTSTLSKLGFVITNLSFGTLFIARFIVESRDASKSFRTIVHLSSTAFAAEYYLTSGLSSSETLRKALGSPNRDHAVYFASYFNLLAYLTGK